MVKIPLAYGTEGATLWDDRIRALRHLKFGGQKFIT